MEAVSTSVQDSSVLVQRSTLDLILFCFPFHMSQVKKCVRDRQTHTHLSRSVVCVCAEKNQTVTHVLFYSFQATRPDMIRILSAALHVVLRRDMSLNRRLYAWLLGVKYTHRHITDS